MILKVQRDVELSPDFWRILYAQQSEILAYGEGYRPAVTAGRAALADLAMKMRIIVRSQAVHFSKYPEPDF